MTSELLDELERAARGRDPAQLAVYADALQRAGDPRGDVIALDLAIAAGHSTRALLDERELALWTWLVEDGDFLAADGVTLHMGYVELRVFSNVPDVLAVGRSRLAEWVVEAELYESVSFAAFASREWPRLTKLTIEGAVASDAFAIAQDRPSLRSLVVTSPRRYERTVATMPAPQGSFPSVAHVALGILDDAWRALALPPERWPALRSLDLTACHDEDATIIGRNRVFEHLAEIGVAAQLHELGLPAIVGTDDVTHVQDALDRMPSLRRVVAPKVWAPGRPVFRHPTAVLDVGRPTPWGYTRGTLVIDGVTCPLAEARATMERVYLELPREVADAWDQLWLVADHMELIAGDGELLPATIAAMFASPLITCWSELRARAPQHAPVTLQLSGLRGR